MEGAAVEAVNMVAEGGADLSIWALFLQADLVVKAVMVGLVLTSVWSWGIIFDKFTLIGRVNKLADRFEEKFWSGGSLDDLYESMNGRPRDPMSALFIAAMKEWRRSAETSRAPGELSSRSAGIALRLERVMQITLDREVERMERQVPFLASTGSAAPFVGLFGTVWGIMNSFHAIGLQKDTSLAVVAPGIAEALFATALGLIAAIPATIAYNKLSHEIDRFAKRLENFSGEFGAILSRQLEGHN